jgi:hypothetical protein
VLAFATLVNCKCQRTASEESGAEATEQNAAEEREEAAQGTAGGDEEGVPGDAPATDEAPGHSSLTDYRYDPTAPEIAETRCGSCHAVPGAGDHTKENWPGVLARMAAWMGMETREIQSLSDVLSPEQRAKIRTEREELIELGAIPETPLIDAQTWREISNAYVEAAPETMPNPALEMEYSAWDGAKVETIGAERLKGLVISALRMSPADDSLFIVDFSFGGPTGSVGTIFNWTPDAGFTGELAFDNATTAVEPFDGRLLVTNIGDFLPSNDRNGSLWTVQPGESGFEKEQIIGNIPRTPHALPVEDDQVLVSSFGHQVGKLWVAGRGDDGEYVEKQVLMDEPGATESLAVDIDGDGSVEYVTLVAQAYDGVVASWPTEDGSWTTERLFWRSPSFGHSDISTSDIDADGDMDLLVANGDNFDLPGNPPRPYHGVRVYKNDGEGNFEQSLFFPMHGAYAVEAGNFDDDDELEIAAVAYFLQPETSSQNFVILDRDEDGQWQPYNAGGDARGKFCRIAVGDLDDSGLDEVYLGACYRQPPEGSPPRVVQVSFD